jgi:hypothetical protein
MVSYRVTMFRLWLPLLLIFYLLSQPHAVQAATQPCKPIFGGGIYCSATSIPTANKEPAGSSNPTMTKGGLQVHTPSQTNKTPDTGPETLALIGLLPAAGIGMWLRRKTNAIAQ